MIYAGVGAPYVYVLHLRPQRDKVTGLALVDLSLVTGAVIHVKWSMGQAVWTVDDMSWNPETEVLTLKHYLTTPDLPVGTRYAFQAYLDYPPSGQLRSKPTTESVEP